MDRLIEAISQNDLGELDYILFKHPKLLNSTDDDERTPLHWAATFNRPQLAKILLDKGATFEEDANGWTPLHIASSIGSEEMIDVLRPHLTTVDINTKTTQGVTALDLATSKNHYDVAKDLVQNKASVRSKNKYGLNALHRASSIGSEPLVRFLIDRGGQINVTDNEGWTPLHHALAEGRGDIAVILVDLGADINVKNNEGKVPLDVAVDESTATFFKNRIE